MLDLKASTTKPVPGQVSISGQSVEYLSPRERAHLAASLVIYGTYLKPTAMDAAKACQVSVARVAQEIAKISTADATNPVLDAIWNATTEAERVGFVRRNQGSLWRVFDQISTPI
jgi:hypothetical protein